MLFNHLTGKTNLHILRDGYCHSDYIRQLYDKDEACEIAQNRFEWNPVCASNGKTYANPFIFFCKTGKNNSQYIIKFINRNLFIIFRS